MKFLVINGPNLNMMHFTEPGVAGQLDYNGLLDYLELCCTQMGMEVEFFQSNHEGDLIDEIQSAAGRADGIILNPGGYAHYSVAILDALRLCGVPAVEVLLSEPRDELLDTCGILRCTADQLDALDPSAVRAKRVGAFGCEALVRRDGVPANWSVEPVNIEQIMLFLTRGEDAR